MNREFKFRLWNKNAKSYVKDFNQENAEITILNTLCNNVSSLDSYIIQQFTGAKDKNNKDIYEGDILLYSDQDGDVISQVVYIEDAACYYIFDKDNNGDTLDCVGPDVCEVIGNIFENKEILE